MEVPVNDYIAKLVLLEAAVGHKVQYKTLAPFSLKPGTLNDEYVEIQLAARRIADFVGLNALTFLIEPVPLGAGTCGRIELRSGPSEVYVQLSPDLFAFPESILATLSHEISHKFLYMNGLSWGNGLENHYHNEVLTDITAVFLGLGKLMLNGRRIERVIEDRSGRKVQSHEVGYLTGDQLAFVYAIVCHMRRISRSDFIDGLSSNCAYTIAQTLFTFRQYFRPEFHEVYAVRKIRDDCAIRISKAYQNSKSLSQEIKRLQDLSKIDTTPEALAQSNVIAAEIKAFDEGIDPCLRYLSALRLDELSKHPVVDIEGAKRNIAAAIRDVEKARRRLEAGVKPTGLFRRIRNLLNMK